MITWASALLATYMLAAYPARLPKVSALSHRWPQGAIVWAWYLWLGYHFIREARRNTPDAL